MDIHQLDQDLPVVDGTLTLTTSSVNGLLNDFLTQDNAGQPLIIESAHKVVTTEVVVDGTVSYLNIANAPIHAVFSIQSDSSVLAVMTITLPSGWTFGTSFTALPPFDEQGDTALDVLDQMVLTGPYFVITTAAGTDASGAPLQPGLNFIAQTDPTGLSGLFASLLGGRRTTYLLYGTIAMPVAGIITPPLLPKQLPWDATWAVPGIALQASLGTTFTLSSLSVTDLVWRVYSPTDATWLASNPSYSPILAVTAEMAVPSASISADVTAAVILSASTVVLEANFNGVTVGTLANLADLVHGSDLDTILPPHVASQIDSVAVEWASVSVSGSLSADAVDYVVVEVGLPNVQWPVSDLFTVTGIGAYFTVLSPFTSARALAVAISGQIVSAGVTLDIVTQYPGFATLAEGSAEVPLQQVFTAIGSTLPAPPELNVDVLQISIIPGQQYRFTVRAADDPPWTLEIGSVPMTIGSVTVDVWDGGQGLQGTFGGTLEFDDNIETSIVYSTPGSFTIRAEFPQIDLSEIIQRLDQIGVTVPSGFDITFDQSYILIEDDGGNLTFSVATLIDTLGLVALTAQKSGGQWGFAAGVQLQTGGLSSIPGLGPLAKLESFVGLEQILLLVSSLTDPGFTFPDMADFDAQPLQGQSMPIPPQANGVVQGINLYAQLNAATDAGLQLLAKYLGIKLDGSVGIALSVSAPDPLTNTKLFITVNANINSNTQVTGQLGVGVQGGDFEVFLTATLKTTIQSQPATFTLGAFVLPTGALIAGTMQGTIQFAPVQLSNVAIAVGIDDAGIPSLGFAATIDVDDFESSIAIFFDSTDPTKSMFAGSVDNVNLLQVADAIAGQNNIPADLSAVLAQFSLTGQQLFTLPATIVTSLDNRDIAAITAAFAQGGVTLPSAFDQIFFVVNTAGSLWHLTDLSTMNHYELTLQQSGVNVAMPPQIYCAPQTTFIGSLKYLQGVHIIADIDAYLVKADIQVEIQAGTGIAATVTADPIQIYSANVFTVTGAGGQGGPTLSLATFQQPNEPDPKLQPPHFLLSGGMQILGAESSASIYVYITSSGLQFEFSEQVAGAVSVDLKGSVSSSGGLQVSGSITVGIDDTFDGGALGTIHVTTTVNGSATLTATFGGAQATAQGSFQFGGLSSPTIPPTTLDVTTAALANLPSTLWTQIVDILNKALLDSTQWLKWLAGKIVQGAGQTPDAVGKILVDVYHLGGLDIIKQTSSILNYGIDDVTSALDGAGISAQDAANFLAQAGYSTADIIKAIEEVFSGQGHIDFSFGHVDTPAGPHTDTSHADGAGPHVDGNHADTTPHVDAKKWGIHTDFQKHVDGSGPHIDQGSHVDKGIPHVDGAVPPHGDTSTHIDS
jgi:hypothetical protein